MEEAVKRLRERGWDAVRPALSTTVRMWIMHSLFSRYLQNNFISAVEFIGNALEILDWGRAKWKDVALPDKGIIFQRSFIRSVRCLYLETLGEAIALNELNNSRDPKYNLENILKGVNEIIEDLKTDAPPEPHSDIGFVLSFYKYPLGRAYAMKGFYHKERAKSLPASPQKAKEIRLAAGSYRNASDHYPRDDENRVSYLCSYLENLLECGPTARVALATMEIIRFAASDMRRIWEHSGSGKMGERDRKIKLYEGVEKDLKEQIARGQFTMESRIMPALVPE